MVIFWCIVPKAVAGATTSTAGLPSPVWQRITYPGVRLPDGIGFLITRQEDGLDLSIGGPKAFLESGRISVRLFEANGQAIAPLNDPAKSVCGLGSFGGINWHSIIMFPWGSNVLEEAWIKVTIGSRRIWLEIPYGFTRNPQDRPPKPAAEGDARFASVMAYLVGNTNAVDVSQPSPPFYPSSARVRPAADTILHWASVQYSSIPIQNGWILNFIKWNRLSAGSEVVLHRDDGYMKWNLDLPRTALRVHEWNGSVATAREVGVFLHDDGMNRSDLFNLASTGSDDENRRWWGRLEIDVDGKPYFIETPSSLVKYDHGTVNLDSKTW